MDIPPQPTTATKLTRVTTSRPDPAYGVTVGLNTGVFYEGCLTFGSSSWKCSYQATNHWYQKTENANFQNYYLPALKAVDIPGKIKCLISLIQFALSATSGSADPSGIIDDCRAIVA